LQNASGGKRRSTAIGVGGTFQRDENERFADVEPELVVLSLEQFAEVLQQSQLQQHLFGAPTHAHFRTDHLHRYTHTQMQITQMDGGGVPEFVCRRIEGSPEWC
jgi:hypothetical protein